MFFFCFLTSIYPFVNDLVCYVAIFLLCSVLALSIQIISIYSFINGHQSVSYLSKT